MVYSTEYGHTVHRDCANFMNGLCTLSGAAVDPKGAACPRFTPKSMTKQHQVEAVYPEAKRFYQIFPPQMGQSRPIGRHGERGRVMRGGRGRDRVRGVTVRTQEKEALTQLLEELEKQLKDVRGRLEKLQ